MGQPNGTVKLRFLEIRAPGRSTLEWFHNVV